MCHNQLKVWKLQDNLVEQRGTSILDRRSSKRYGRLVPRERQTMLLGECMNRAHTVVPRIEVLVDRTQLDSYQTKFEMTSFQFLISIGKMRID